MTEKEAKTKWCPPTLSSDNWDMCQGSACMAWRWTLTAEKAKYFNEKQRALNEPEATATGYCGLAGKP